METTIRIDKETYGSTAINEHQQKSLSRIFEKLINSQSEINIFFEFDTFSGFYQAYLEVPKKEIQFELPFIKKKNRIFRNDNFIIPEKFLLNGENIIYIFDLIFQDLGEQITFKKVVERLKLFETSDEAE